VRAKYNNHAKNIYATTKYLNRFFENLILGENHILKNRELHIHFVEIVPVNDQKLPVNEENILIKNKKFPVIGEKFLVNNKKFPVIGLEIIKLMENKPNITIIELSKQLNISDRAVKNNINKLRNAGIIVRTGSDKTGNWKILEPKEIE
jgi:predicted HTH transcriptional regulator